MKKIFLALLFFMQTGLVISQSSKSGIQGMVFDKDFHPITGANVSIDGSIYVTSDPSGNFFVQDFFDEKPQSIEIIKPGYELAAWDIKKGRLEIMLKKAEYRLLMGRVRYPDAQPASGVVVTFLNANPKIQATTGSKGEFRMQFPNNVVHQLSSRSEFLVNGKKAATNQMTFTDGYAFVLLQAPNTPLYLRKGAPFQVKIVEKDGRPVRRSLVEAENIKYRTDNNGVFTFMPSGNDKKPIFSLRGYKLVKIDSMPEKDMLSITVDHSKQFANFSEENLPSDTVFNEYEGRIEDLLSSIRSEKVELTDKARRIKNEIGRIKDLLKADVAGIEEKQKQKVYLSELERSLLENDLMYQKLQREMQVLVEQLKTSLSEKEDLVQAMAEEQTKAAHQFQKNLLVLLTLAFFFLALAIMLFITVRKISTQNKRLSKIQRDLRIKMQETNLQHLKITDSIRYGQTIQQAILPGENRLRNAFGEQMTIYLPKDIVSGDFFWYNNFIEDEMETHFLAVVDCTGHGVPGAFMSMIGNTLLNEIINQKLTHQPEEILEILNTEVKLALRQYEHANDDGMDVCLCKMEKFGNEITKVTFAGAKRPLYVTRNRYQTLEYYKGVNKTIGGISKKERRYESREIYLRQGDSLYLTSDGLIDQHDEHNKKFGSQRLANILQKNMEKPLSEVKAILLEALHSHQGTMEQRDDITILGVRI